VVLDIGYNSGAGNFIVIRHDFNDKKILTKYFHLMKNSTIVTIGQKLKKGQRIAKMGSTGSSTEAHLHFEAHVYKNSRWEHFDPLELFNKSY
jgi:murein DD-endopeptidase MepM/ murein hydrolase activator NlpD